MIQINPDNMVRIELTPKEQKTVIQHCPIDRDIYDRIQNAQNGVLHLLAEDCYHLKGCIQAGIQTAKKPKIQNILGTVFNKLSPNPIVKSIADEIEAQNFDNIDDLNDHLQGVMSSRNASPDPEMGGLSPEQVAKLIYSSWDDDKFPLKFNKQLKYSDVKDSDFFTNTTTFLKTLIEMEKEPTATARGNLNRKIVKILFDKIVLDEDYKRFTLQYNKVINDEDVFPLHIMRIVCEGAGLIHIRKNKFMVVKKYHDLISEERAGELYHMLFNSYFTKFNISYLDRLSEIESIQETIAYSIFRLGEIADRWIGIEDLAEQILLPSVRDEVRATLSEHVFIEWIICSRIIEPLQGLGLLKGKYRGKKGDSEMKKVKKTRLFDRLIRVEW